MKNFRQLNDSPLATHLQGQAGVWQVASQLAIRGKLSLFPGVDYGYDLALENGVKIQVKTSRLKFSHPAYPQGFYSFDWRQYRYVKGKNDYSRPHTDYSKVADYFACWGVDDNRFWIFPTSISQRAIWFPRTPKHVWLDPDEIRKLREEGMTYQAIADKVGTSYTDVWRTIRRTSKRNDEQSARFLYTFEDRWDLLDSKPVDTVKALVDSAASLRDPTYDDLPADAGLIRQKEKANVPTS